MKPWLVLAVASFSLGLPAPARADANVPLWQRWEHVLSADKESSRSHSAVEVDVSFTGPDGASLKTPAFWNGNSEFRIRMAFPSQGTWRWRTTCSDPADAGLHGQSGTVHVTSARSENPLYRHGDLRVSSDKRYLVHADGTPFLWMGDTGWNAAWKSTMPEWQEYVDTRAQQRFSVLQVVATGTRARNSTMHPATGLAPFTADGAPNHPFWRDLEQKIAYANDRGLVVLLTGVGNAPAGFAEQQCSTAFARYLAGRLAGHFVIFSPSMDQRIDPLNDEAGARLRPLTTHLIIQHPGTHFDTARHYHDAPYADFCGLQTGHHGGKLDQAYTAAREWTLDLWQRPPIKPVINIEAMYDAHGHDNAPHWREQDARKLGWITWLSGSRGYTYGAGDVPPKVPGAAGGVWRFNTDPDAYDHWRKASRWPSATHMTHLRDFFAAIDWWRLEPTPEVVKNQAEEPTRKMVVSRSSDPDLLVAYLPDNPEIVLDLQTMRRDVAGRWFNPTTGHTMNIESPVPAGAAIKLSRPPGWTDATLILVPSSR